MSDLPLVSIVMPVLNPGRYLAESLSALAAQTYRKSELVLVDDGTTDGSIESCRELLNRFNRLTVVKHVSPQGIATSLQEGLNVAQGHLFARMDADDICAPERIEQQVWAMQRHPAATLVWTAMRMIDENGQDLSSTRQVGALFPLYAYLRLPSKNVIHHATILARRDVVLQRGGYRGGFGPAEDYDLWLRLLAPRAFVYMPEPLYSCRVHHASTTRSRPILVQWWAAVAQECHVQRRSVGTDHHVIEAAKRVIADVDEHELLRMLPARQLSTLLKIYRRLGDDNMSRTVGDLRALAHGGIRWPAGVLQHAERSV